MILANIVHDEELINHKKHESINYITTPTKYGDIDKNIPTLYVGWELMQKSNPDDYFINSISPLEKKVISNQLFWEFSFSENKSQHVTGVEEFVKNFPQYYFSNKFKYINLDPIFFSISNIDELKLILPKEKEYVYNYKDEMLYLLNNNTVWGIDLKLYSYFNFDIFKLKEEIINTTVEIFDCGEYFSEYNKKYYDFSNLKRYMVIILYYESIYKK